MLRSFREPAHTTRPTRPAISTSRRHADIGNGLASSPGIRRAVAVDDQLEEENQLPVRMASGTSLDGVSIGPGSPSKRFMLTAATRIVL